MPRKSSKPKSAIQKKKDSQKCYSGNKVLDKRKSSVKLMLEEVPIHYKNHFVKAYYANSRKSAIVAKCLECVGFARKEVANCTSYSCPLWSYRPVYKMDKNNERQQQ